MKGWSMVKVVVLLLASGLLIQLVPYGRQHSNPPVTGEPQWDRPRTRELFFRVCKDCHSNETVWPWYSSIAPASWLVQHDVDEARSEFNVSEWGRTGKNKGKDAAEELREGEMPPFQYLLAHPGARLTDMEKAEFIKGLMTTFGMEDEEENRTGMIP